MSTGYILILAVLLLGGVIATVGDRIGTRVGKARLSLFNLRPRKTATLVTIMTGTIIAASTLGILFAASEYLRTGVFQLDSIQRQLRRVSYPAPASDGSERAGRRGIEESPVRSQVGSETANSNQGPT